jgi:hypothetical protein
MASRAAIEIAARIVLCDGRENAQSKPRWASARQAKYAAGVRCTNPPWPQVRMKGFIPISIQTCASPHVYPSGKHAVFRKMDAQLPYGIRIASIRRRKPMREQAFHGENKLLDNGNASMLANRPVARLNALSFAPFSKSFANQTAFHDRKRCTWASGFWLRPESDTMSPPWNIAYLNAIFSVIEFFGGYLGSVQYRSRGGVVKIFTAKQNPFAFCHARRPTGGRFEC